MRERGFHSAFATPILLLIAMVALDAGQMVPIVLVRTCLTLPGALVVPGWALAWLASGSAPPSLERLSAAVIASLATLLVTVVALSPLGVGITHTSVVIALNVVVGALLLGVLVTRRRAKSERV